MALIYLYLRFFLKELVFSEGGEEDDHINLLEYIKKSGGIGNRPIYWLIFSLIIGMLMHLGPPRPLESSELRISMTSTPF